MPPKPSQPSPSPRKIAPAATGAVAVPGEKAPPARPADQRRGPGRERVGQAEGRGDDRAERRGVAGRRRAHRERRARGGRLGRARTSSRRADAAPGRAPRPAPASSAAVGRHLDHPAAPTASRSNAATARVELGRTSRRPADAVAEQAVEDQAAAEAGSPRSSTPSADRPVPQPEGRARSRRRRRGPEVGIGVALDRLESRRRGTALDPAASRLRNPADPRPPQRGVTSRHLDANVNFSPCADSTAPGMVPRKRRTPPEVEAT